MISRSCPAMRIVPSPPSPIGLRLCSIATFRKGDTITAEKNAVNASVASLLKGWIHFVGQRFLSGHRSTQLESRRMQRPPQRDPEGVLLVDKKAGITSHDVV